MSTNTDSKQIDKNESTSFMIDLSQSSQSGNPFDAIVVDNRIDEEPVDSQVEEQVEEETHDEVLEASDETSEQSSEEDGELQEELIGGVEDEEEDDSEDGSDVNPYFYLQQQLKSEGFIEDDTEFGEDVDGMSVYMAYKQKLRKDLEPAIREEVINELANAGINEGDILYARAIRNGIDPRLLNTVSAYEYYATVPDDADEDSKVSGIKAMYQDRGLDSTEADKIIDSSDDIDDLFAKSKQYFTQKYQGFAQQQEELQRQQQQSSKAEIEKAQNLIKSILTEKSILGEQLSDVQAKELEESIYRESQIVEYNGGRYRATELQKFLLEFETNPELKLYMFKKWKFKDQDRHNLENQVKKEVEDDFLKGYKTRVVKSQKATKNKAIKQKLQENKQASNSFFIDLTAGRE